MPMSVPCLRCLRRIVCAAVLILLSNPESQSVLAHPFAGGSGTPDDPYQIATADQLIAIGSDGGSRDKCFILTSDIDLDANIPAGRVFDHAVIVFRTSNSLSVTDEGFAGTFDGGGHTIRNLRISAAKSYLGLFDAIASPGIVRNLRIENARLGYPEYASRAGVLAGANYGAVVKCGASGEIRGFSYVGGLVGESHGTIAECYARCDVRGLTGWIGGLVGSAADGRITDCYAGGEVLDLASDYIGGLIGANDGAYVFNCYASGPVYGGNYVGGLAGDVSATDIMRHCFWDAQASKQTWSPGAFGRSTAQMKDRRTFVGWTDRWTLQDGRDYPRLAWESSVGVPLSNHPDRTYSGSGTTEQPFLLRDANDMLCMMARAEDWSCSFDVAQDIDLADAGPWLPLAGFTGTFDGRGHRILNLTLSENTGPLGLFGCLRLGCVRDLELVNAHVSGSSLWVGVLVGHNDRGSVRDCSASGTISVGLVRRLTIAFVSEVGGLVGANSLGMLSGCRAACSVAGTGPGTMVGGLVGLNSGHVTACRATGTVSGGEDRIYSVGGLAGQNSGTISNSYAGGSVSMPRKVDCAGGVVGVNEGCVICSYSTAGMRLPTPNDCVGGLVGWSSGCVIDCFWDVQKSGLIRSAGGTGLSTSQMKDNAIYSAARWDFVGERSNGTCELWFMPEGGDAPELTIHSPDYRRPPLMGGGTPDDPYRIGTPEDLGAVCHYAGPCCFRLMQDIDLGGIIWSQDCIPRLEGVLDGAGHAITGLTMRGGSSVGLFGRIAEQAAVIDLDVVNASVIAGNGSTLFGIVTGDNHGSITRCSASGSLSCEGECGLAGLLAGINMGTIHQCRIGGDIGAKGRAQWLGGAVGYNHGDLIGCESSVDILCRAGGAKIGGLAGAHGMEEASPGRIVGCCARGDLVCGRDVNDVGGLLGDNHGSVIQSFASGKVDGPNASTWIGGLIGSNSGPVADCYARGNVAGEREVGGLVGYAESGEIQRCYAAGHVSGGEDAGGFIGLERDAAVCKACFWDRETSGQAVGIKHPPDSQRSDDVTGPLTSEMQTAQPFLDAGWDLQNVWTICEGKDYPRLRWEGTTCP